MSKFLVIALVGLWFVPMTRWAQRRHTSYWWWAALGTLLMGVVLLVMYADMRRAWTISYAQTTVVIGDSLTADADHFTDSLRTFRNRQLTDGELLEYYVGDRDRVWVSSGVRSREIRLLAVYLTLIALFASTVVTIVQATFCATATRRRSTT